MQARVCACWFAACTSLVSVHIIVAGMVDDVISSIGFKPNVALGQSRRAMARLKQQQQQQRQSHKWQ